MTPRVSRIRAAALLLGLLAGPLSGVEPTLRTVLPRGGKRGAETDVVLRGDRLADAREILWYGSGLETVSLEAKGGKEIHARVRIADDCPLGEHALRLRCATGVSELRTFWVGPFAVTSESEPNGDFDGAQEISPDATVEGVITSEDVDRFVFAGKAGERISVEVEGMRLGDSFFDAFVCLYDERRFEIASSDDTPLLGQDPACQAKLPSDGRYVVEVRESSYRGDDRSRYRLHVGRFPRPTVAFPPGATAGQETTIRLLGDVGGDLPTRVKTPPDAEGTIDVWPADAAGPAPSPLPLRVSSLPCSEEKEPNDAPRAATPGTAPGALHGIIERPGDVDHFRVEAKKGQTFEVTVWARRLGSPLDPVLRVADERGKRIEENDDSEGADCRLRFTAPGDGGYILRLRDHLGRGGPDHVYRVEVAPVTPRLAVSLPKVQPFSQERQVVCVPRGGRAVMPFNVSRQDIGGGVVVAGAGLPAGVTMAETLVANGLNSYPLVLEAAPDAPLAAALARLDLRPEKDGRPVGGGFRQIVELVVGNPGQAVYCQRAVHRLAVAVVETPPFGLEIAPVGVPLVRGGALDLAVQAKRSEGFEGEIALEVTFHPSGVSSARGVKIAPDATSATLRLNAAGGARLGSWPISVDGVAGAPGGGRYRVSSPVAMLRVEEPWVLVTLDRSSVEQGQETVVSGKVEVRQAFEGQGRARLVGLPHGVTSQELEITPGTKELVFPVSAAKDSPPGRHRSVFCQVTIAMDRGTVAHGTPATELRVDRPLPPPKQPRPPPEKPQPEKKPEPEKKPPPPKRLTRLERLRQEALERRRAGSGGQDTEPSGGDGPAAGEGPSGSPESQGPEAGKEDAS